MKYRVLVEQDEDGYFVAEVPSLPGCVSQGDTREDALKNVREAIAGYLESLEEHEEPVPPSIHEEIVEVCFGGAASRLGTGGSEGVRQDWLRSRSSAW